mmetsp:Transcript_3437/g.8121  ORF Transcript_3437/g.8121 Transcript_3437/m.8121 type:complete len:225 (+) Transcript_3437:201-875(+)
MYISNPPPLARPCDEQTNPCSLSCPRTSVALFWQGAQTWAALGAPWGHVPLLLPSERYVSPAPSVGSLERVTPAEHAGSARNRIAGSRLSHGFALQTELWSRFLGRWRIADHKITTPGRPAGDEPGNPARDSSDLQKVTAVSPASVAAAALEARRSAGRVCWHTSTDPRKELASSPRVAGAAVTALHDSGRHQSGGGHLSSDPKTPLPAAAAIGLLGCPVVSLR